MAEKVGYRRTWIVIAGPIASARVSDTGRRETHDDSRAMIRAMPHQLSKELRDAGFPNIQDVQHRQGREFLDPNDRVSVYSLGEIASTEDWFIPTLEELIEACGDDFKCVRNSRHEMWDSQGRVGGDRQFEGAWPDSPEWVAEAVRTYSGAEGTTGQISRDGQTPTDAVARLWLALNKTAA
jgi:hypothetical protein